MADLRAPPDSTVAKLLRAFGEAMGKTNELTKVPGTDFNLGDLAGLGGAGRILEKLANGQRVLPTMTQPADPEILDLAGVMGGITPGAKTLARGMAREMANYKPKVGAKAQRGAIDAFHGSPHDIPEKPGFQDSKIDSGEGTQMEGWGHYSADSRDIAEGYANTLGARSLVTPEGKLLQHYSYKNGPKDEAYEIAREVLSADLSGGLDKSLDKAIKIVDRRFRTSPRIDEIAEYLKEWAAQKAEMGHSGKLYDIQMRWPSKTQERFDPLEAKHFLHRDLKLGDQPHIVDRIRQGERDGILPYGLGEQHLIQRGDQSSSWGRKYQDNLRNELGEKEASRALYESGIPGVEYYGGGMQSPHYVAFHEALMNIMRKRKMGFE